jgi:hypothetical protein
MALAKLNRQVLLLTVFTLITVIAWISINIYLAATQSTITDITADQLAPFDPALKSEVLTILQNETK